MRRLTVSWACTGRVTGVLMVAALLMPVGAGHLSATATSVQMAQSAAAASLIDRDCDVDEAWGTAECYWLEVPERRDVPTAATIRLWVAVLHPPHADPDLPPVVFNPGGPGAATSTGFVNDDYRYFRVPGSTLVVMDARGTGRSQPRLDCPESSGMVPTAAYEDRVEHARLTALACKQRLVAEGVDLDGYDTIEAAADFVALRRALGYDQFVLAGTSYGGRLMREVYRQDPAGVAALVLDSPLTTAPQGPASLVQRAEDAVDRLDAACDAAPSCAALGDLRENFETAAARLESTPYQPPGLLPFALIDGGVYRSGAFQAAYSTDLLPTLPAIGAQIAAGDYTTLDSIRELLTPEPPTPFDATAGGTANVVYCADQVYTDDDRAILADPGPWEDLVIGNNCDIWDVAPVPGGRLEAPTGDVPVFAGFGQFDPVVPPSFADEVLEQFPHATVVVVPAAGHGVMYDSNCMVLLTTTFVRNPTSQLNTSCVDNLPALFD